MSSQDMVFQYQKQNGFVGSTTVKKFYVDLLLECGVVDVKKFISSEIAALRNPCSQSISRIITREIQKKNALSHGFDSMAEMALQFSTPKKPLKKQVNPTPERTRFLGNQGKDREKGTFANELIRFESTVNLIDKREDAYLLRFNARYTAFDVLVDYAFGGDKQAALEYLKTL